MKLVWHVTKLLEAGRLRNVLGDLVDEEISLRAYLRSDGDRALIILVNYWGQAQSRLSIPDVRCAVLPNRRLPIARYAAPADAHQRLVDEPGDQGADVGTRTGHWSLVRTAATTIWRKARNRGSVIHEPLRLADPLRNRSSSSLRRHLTRPGGPLGCTFNESPLPGNH
jgi:hypothetical protein